MKDKRRRRLKLIVAFVVTLLGLLIGEVVLRIKNTTRTPRRDRDAWHEFDPTLGWRAKPNWKGEGTLPVDEPVTFAVRLNAQGWRSDRDYPPRAPQGVRRICLVGDSYTFAYGCEVEDGLVPRLDRILGDRTEVLNLGTCAHGVDQMRLVVEHHALDLKPDLIVVGVIHQNFRRALRTVSITGHRKPRFVLNGDDPPRLTGVPLPPPAEEGDLVYKDQPPEGGSFLVWQLGKLGDRIGVALAEDEEAARPRWRLGKALLLDAQRIARARDVPLVVALFPQRKNLDRGEPLRALLATLDPDLPVCDVYPLFEDHPDPASLFLEDGHPSPAGHALMALALAEFIRERRLLD